MSEASEMERRLAAEASPVASDAPDDPSTASSGVPYDAGLLAELAEHGPAALAEFGQITVRGCGEAARYNAAVWYALSFGETPGGALAYELRGDCVLISDPGKASGA